MLVGNSLSRGLRLVQEHSGLPAATVHLWPVCLPLVTWPSLLPAFGDRSWLPVWALRALRSAAERLLVDCWGTQRLNRLRAGLGLAPVQRVLSRWMHSPDLVIGAWPDWFAPPQPDWPAQAQTSGFALFHESSHGGGGGLDLSLEAFLSAGPDPTGRSLPALPACWRRWDGTAGDSAGGWLQSAVRDDRCAPSRHKQAAARQYSTAWVVRRSCAPAAWFGAHPIGSWLRRARWRRHAPFAGPENALIYVMVGHEDASQIGDRVGPKHPENAPTPARSVRRVG